MVLVFLCARGRAETKRLGRFLLDGEPPPVAAGRHAIASRSASWPVRHGGTGTAAAVAAGPSVPADSGDE